MSPFLFPNLAQLRTRPASPIFGVVKVILGGPVRRVSSFRVGRSSMTSKAVLLFVVATLAAVPLKAGEFVSHQQLGIRLTVPDGFVSDPERVQGNVIYAFQRPPVGDEGVGVFILVSQLRSVLDRRKINPKDLQARSPHVTIVTDRWKGFDVEAFRVPEQVDDLQLLTFNAQVPLKPRAIQVSVIGKLDREVELRGILRSVLGNLDGQTNWLDNAERVRRLSKGITRLAITIGVLVVAVVAIWRAVRRRKSVLDRA